MNIGTVSQIIGKTPLIKIRSLSEISGCEIYGKAEFLNPGGSVKDRTARGIVEEALRTGKVKKGDRIFEGTAGNTGIGLAVVCADLGLKCTIVMPDNQSVEKYAVLESLGVDLVRVPAVPFKDQNHFYHTAKRLADESGCFWANQFENTANHKAHYETTGPEIFEQTEGRVDAFACASGTGGTIGGVSRFLKEKKPSVVNCLIDPQGSGLYSWYHTGEIKSEGGSVTEGIGIMRLTVNMKSAQLDDAIQVSDADMLNMLYHLSKNDGLLMGPSGALNAFGILQMALRERDSGKTFVTILCDSGSRYLNRIFNSDWLSEKGLTPQPEKIGEM